MCLLRGKSGERVVHSLRRLRYPKSPCGRDRDGYYVQERFGTPRQRENQGHADLQGVRLGSQGYFHPFMERAHAFGYLVAYADEGALRRKLDPLVGHGRVGQRNGYHKAPQRGRPERRRLADPDGHPPEPVPPHPSIEEDGAYTWGQGDLRDGLRLLPQRGGSRRGEREPVGQRPLRTCPVADDLPERQ